MMKQKKREIFNRYAKEVATRYEIDEDVLFTKCKIPHIAEARHMFIYLCSKRHMRPTMIKQLLAERGYDTASRPITYSINVMNKKVRYDIDSREMYNEIKTCVEDY